MYYRDLSFNDLTYIISSCKKWKKQIYNLCHGIVVLGRLLFNRHVYWRMIVALRLNKKSYSRKLLGSTEMAIHVSCLSVLFNVTLQLCSVGHRRSWFSWFLANLLKRNNHLRMMNVVRFMSSCCLQRVAKQLRKVNTRLPISASY